MTSFPSGAAKVHPRLRGELTKEKATDYLENGSSPLARGTRLQTRSASIRPTVHPRLRGELTCTIFVQVQAIGSSPLARGTRSLAILFQAKDRFIPACAGNSLKMVTTLH